MRTDCIADSQQMMSVAYHSDDFFRVIVWVLSKRPISLN